MSEKNPYEVLIEKLSQAMEPEAARDLVDLCFTALLKDVAEDVYTEMMAQAHLQVADISYERWNNALGS